MHARVVLGVGKGVLFREVSLQKCSTLLCTIIWPQLIYYYSMNCSFVRKFVVVVAIAQLPVVAKEATP